MKIHSAVVVVVVAVVVVAAVADRAKVTAFVASKQFPNTIYLS